MERTSGMPGASQKKTRGVTRSPAVSPKSQGEYAGKLSINSLITVESKKETYQHLQVGVPNGSVTGCQFTILRV